MRVGYISLVTLKLTIKWTVQLLSDGQIFYYQLVQHYIWLSTFASFICPPFLLIVHMHGNSLSIAILTNISLSKFFTLEYLMVLFYFLHIDYKLTGNLLVTITALFCFSLSKFKDHRPCSSCPKVSHEGSALFFCRLGYKYHSRI